MRLPYPFTMLGVVQLLAGLVIVLDPFNTVSAATIRYFGGIATPLFIGVFTAFCGALILYSRWRRYPLSSWKRTLLAAPMLLYCVTILLISRNTLVMLIIGYIIYDLLWQTGFSSTAEETHG